jgi:hypothetical protein
MNTHTDPTPTITLPHGDPDVAANEQAAGGRTILVARIPEWRRRSLEGRGRFEAVTDTTGLVAL